MTTVRVALLLKRSWPYLAISALLFACLAVAYWRGGVATAERYERKMAQQAQANADALATAHAGTRAKEYEAAQTQAAIEARHLMEMNDAKTRTDRTIANLRAGNIRLRDEIASAECAIAGVSEIATGTGERDAACAGGLRPEHAEFLIRFADRADAVALQLKAAQDIIRADRQVMNGNVAQEQRR